MNIKMRRLQRLEEKFGFKDNVRVIWLHTPLYCERNRKAGEIYNGCQEIIIGPGAKQVCNTCGYKNICSQRQPERFKKLWEKHLKSQECKTCTPEEKKKCGLSKIEQALKQGKQGTRGMIEKARK